MTQGATAWAAVVFPLRLGTLRSLASKFSCNRTDKKSINKGSVKALLPGRGDLLPLARVGSWLLAYAFMTLTSCPKNKPGDQAQAVELTPVHLPKMTAAPSDHGRH